MKRCKTCGGVKPLDGFYAHPKARDGRLGSCVACCRAAAIEVRRRNSERIREYERARYKRPERRKLLADMQRMRRHRLRMATEGPLKVAVAKLRQENATQYGKTLTRPAFCLASDGIPAAERNLP